MYTFVIEGVCLLGSQRKDDRYVCGYKKIPSGIVLSGGYYVKVAFLLPNCQGQSSAESFL